MKLPQLLQTLAYLWFACLIGAVSISDAADIDGKGKLPTNPAFERDVYPIMKTHCIACHGETKTEGKLDLRQKRLALKGGENGPAIVPGNAEESALWQRMTDGEMPPEHIKVRPTAEQIRVVQRWIDAGAVNLRAESADPSTVPEIMPEEREHWAYQPIARVSVPEVAADKSKIATPVDAFLLKELTKAGLTFSPEATRESLIRRLSFDVRGLPPTPEEIAEFKKDQHPDAWARLVERFLASQQYGEQWARHWLDVAGYADSEGGNELDSVREEAWKYRDYVIRALNQDKPFNRFVTEQVAGDELVGYPLPQRPTQQQAELLAATGFLRMAPDPTGRGDDNTPALRNQVISDTVKIVSSAFYGLTIGCAECHNHRYDPILQKDYYRIRAVFEPGFDPARWKTPAQRKLSFVKPGDEAANARVNELLKPAQKKLDEAVEKARQHVFADELKKLATDDQRAMAKAGWRKAVKERSAEEKKLFEDYPNLDVPKSIGALKLYLELDKSYKPFNNAIEEVEKEIAAIGSKRPAADTFRAFVESDQARSKPPETHVLYRGDVESPRLAVASGDLTVLYESPSEAEIEPVGGLKSTGRRLAFAARLTSGEHPLLARVIVNRVWMNHFGRGLVETPGDFGSQGSKPTHPELLDWLAADFMSHGWSLKHLHRRILMSLAWRQSSARNVDMERLDPENRLLGRMNMRRLSAENLRDSLLSIAGELRTTAFGPPVKVSVTEDGQPQVQGAADAVNRRSVYLQVMRQSPLPALTVFDSPMLDPNCETRNSSNVPTQALWLMNDAFISRVAEKFAKRLTSLKGDDKSRIQEACELAWGRSATAQEQQVLADFLKAHRDEVLSAKADPNARRSRPEAFVTEAPPDKFDVWMRIAQTILQANAFLYVD